MSNICKNLLTLSGDRDEVISAILKGPLNFKNNKIYDLENMLCLLFQSDWEPPVDTIEQISIEHPKVYFQLVYREELLNKTGVYRFKGGEIEHIIKESSFSFSRFNKPFCPENLLIFP